MYPHRWRVVRAGAGSQDPDTGAWVPGAGEVVYDGAADCQDEGETVRRDTEGREVAISDATLYLADERAAARHKVGDRGVVTWEDGTTSDAEVARVVRLDGKLHLKWL